MKIECVQFKTPYKPDLKKIAKEADDREKEDRYKVSNPGNRNITKLLWKKEGFSD